MPALQKTITHVLLFFSYLAMGQSGFVGLPSMQHFSPDDYQAGILNYSIAQSPAGFILVGNNHGLMEYDGTNWRVYKLPVNSRIRAFTSDDSGYIYVGSQNEIGYFAPDNRGHYVFQSLKELLPSGQTQFDDVWSIYISSVGVIYATVKGLYIYKNEQIEFIPFIQLSNLTFHHKNRIYNQVPGQGLFVLDGKKWEMADNGRFFSDKEITSIVSFNQQYDLISTRESGLFIVGQHTIEPWVTNLNKEFSSQKILTLTQLNNGSYLIGTETGGIYIIQKDKTIKAKYTKTEGLKSNTVLSSFEDSFGNIWLSHSNGITKIELSSPFAYMDERSGLSGTGYDSFENEEYLYLGTNNGLYYRQKSKVSGQHKFKRMEGIEGQVYSISEVNGDLLIGCHFGAYQIVNNQAIEISGGTGWWTFVPTRNPSIAIGGGYSGLFQLKKQNKIWKVEQYYTGFSESSRIMSFDDDGILWMSHGYKGVYRFKFSQDFNRIQEVKFYNENDGFPSNHNINLFEINNELIYGTENGIYVYEAKSDRFIRERSLSELMETTPFVRYLAEDSQGNVIFMALEHTGILRKTNSINFQMEAVSLDKVHRLFNDDLDNISILNNDIVIFASRDGFVSFDKSRMADQPSGAPVYFRRVILSQTDSLIFDGVFTENQGITFRQPASYVYRLPYAANSLAFEFSAKEFDESPSYYQYRLTGFENDWTDWQAKGFKEYTNLREGDYDFQVRSKNAFGTVSDINSFRFSILPPWFRTFTMKVIYMVAFMAFLTYLLYKRSKNKKIIHSQEKALAFQGQELEEISAKSREEIERIKNEKLASEIRMKKNQLASTAMHLIDRNEYIQNIKKNIEEAIQQGSPQKTIHKLKKVVIDIDKNKNAEDDWKQFAKHFDEVHNNFSIKLTEKHPGLTPQELKLSVLLRMNLTTKEIANLNHVTNRAIEMSRHRLRKKLNLEKEENLVDYLLKIK